MPHHPGLSALWQLAARVSQDLLCAMHQAHTRTCTSHASGLHMHAPCRLTLSTCAGLVSVDPCMTTESV